MPRAGLLALVLVACGTPPTGVLETHFATHTQSLHARGLADADALAAVTAAPTGEGAPSRLTVEGPPGPLTEGLTSYLREHGHGVRGSLTITLALPPLTAPAGADLPLTIRIDATWPDPPNIVRAEATITGTLTYKHGGPVEAVPADLGRRIAELIDRELTKLAPTPATLPPLTPATQIAVGQDLACTLHEDRTVRCWGSAPPRVGAIPTPIADLTDVLELDAAADRVCARLQDGAVRCFGHDLEPARVCDVADATAIAVGNRAACALVRDGAVRCWPVQGAFTDPCGGAASVAIPGLQGATAIAAGFAEEAALLPDGRVTAWVTCTTPRCDAPRPTLKPVPGLAATIHLSADFQPCGLDVAGDLRCATRPEVRALPGATSVILASHRGCARYPDGTARCWRTGLAGEVDGVATLTDHGRLRDLDLGLAAACLVDEMGAPWCWTDFADSVIATRERVDTPRPIAMPW